MNGSKWLLVLSAAVLSVNAQVFIGGSAGVSFSNNDRAKTMESSTWGINAAPKIGYLINEKWAVGISPSLGYEERNIKETSGSYGYADVVVETHSDVKSYSWGGDIFGQYKLVELGKSKKFSLNFEASTGITGINKYYEAQTALTDTTYKIKSFEYDISVRPFFAYTLSDKFDIYTYLNFLTIGYSYEQQKGDSDSDSSKSHRFNFGLSSTSILSVSTLTIGIRYKF